MGEVSLVLEVLLSLEPSLKILLTWRASETRVDIGNLALLVVILWLQLWLHRRKVLNRSLDFEVLNEFLQLNLILRVHDIILLFWVLDWLLLSIVDVDHFVRTVLWPMVVLLVINKVVNVQNMPEVDEAVRSVRLLWVVVLVRWKLQIVEVIFVVHFKVTFDFVVSVSAWNVLYHEACSGFFASQNLLKINRSSISTTHVWEVVAVLWITIISFISFDKAISKREQFFSTAIALATNCSLKYIRLSLQVMKNIPVASRWYLLLHRWNLMWSEMLLVFIWVVAAGNRSEDTDTTSSLNDAVLKDHLLTISWSTRRQSVERSIPITKVDLTNRRNSIINYLVVLISFRDLLQLFDDHQFYLVTLIFEALFEFKCILVICKFNRNRIVDLNIVHVKSFVVVWLDQIH